MIVKDIFSSVSFEDISKCIKRMYPDQVKSLEGYKIVFESIKDIAPELYEEDNEDSYVEFWEEKCGNEFAYGCHEVRPNDDFKFYSMSFMDWKNILALKVNKEECSKYTDAELATMCLYEMTYNGFDQKEIDKKRNQLLKMIKK